MTTKVEKLRVREEQQTVEEADMKARFLVADITAALDRIPDEAVPAVNLHLEQALRTARNAMETKKRETETTRTR